MPRAVPLDGKKFGRWTVQSKADSNNIGVHWKCICECGTVRVVKGQSLTSGRSKSCGCYKAEVDLQKVESCFVKHGYTRNRTAVRTYVIWQNMIRRCTNPAGSAYRNYGQRGITVCERWLHFENFLSDMGDPPHKYTLERVDNNKGYSPENCIWASYKAQANNTRRNRWLTFRGITMTIAQWAEKTGMDYFTLYHRIHKANWPLEIALSEPSRGKR